MEILFLLMMILIPTIIIGGLIAGIVFLIVYVFDDKKKEQKTKASNFSSIQLTPIQKNDTQSNNHYIITEKIPETNITSKAEEVYPYFRKNILTKNEYYFFKKLKEITDRNNLHILTKVRVIDLVDVSERMPYKEKMSWKAKIIQKHVDFVLVNPETFKVYMAIELDDNSHKTKERKERDEFIDKVYKSAKLPMISESKT